MTSLEGEKIRHLDLETKADSPQIQLFYRPNWRSLIGEKVKEIHLVEIIKVGSLKIQALSELSQYSHEVIKDFNESCFLVIMR